jgi:hypothetical protein
MNGGSINPAKLATHQLLQSSSTDAAHRHAAAHTHGQFGTQNTLTTQVSKALQQCMHICGNSHHIEDIHMPAKECPHTLEAYNTGSSIAARLLTVTTLVCLVQQQCS